MKAPQSPERSSRRTLLFGASIGLVAGSAWGAALQALATPTKPSLSIVGREDAQIALLDTTKIRVLILLGIPDNRLQTQIPALLTVFRQRVDILVGSRDAVDALEPGFSSRWHIARTLVVSDDGSGRPGDLTTTLVDGNLDVNLGSGINMHIKSTTRNAWSNVDPTRSFWLASITHGDRYMCLAVDPKSCTLLAPRYATLITCPVADPADLTQKLAPASIATNARDRMKIDTTTLSNPWIIRVFPTDIARFTFDEKGLRLPEWSTRD